MVSSPPARMSWNPWHSKSTIMTRSGLWGGVCSHKGSFPRHRLKTLLRSERE